MEMDHQNSLNSVNHQNKKLKSFDAKEKPATTITTAAATNENPILVLPPPSPPKPKQLTANKIDINVIPIVHDIIRCVERDPSDISAKQRESLECAQKVLELKAHLDSLREQVRKLPGIDYNKDEQIQKFEQLKEQLKLKKELIKKYKNLDMRLPTTTTTTTTDNNQEKDKDKKEESSTVTTPTTPTTQNNK